MPLTIAALFAELPAAPTYQASPFMRASEALLALEDAWREADARIVNKLAEASEDAWLFDEG